MTAPSLLSDDADRKAELRENPVFHELDLSPNNQANKLLMLQHSSDKDHS